MSLQKLLVLADSAADRGFRGLAVQIIETVYQALDSGDPALVACGAPSL